MNKKIEAILNESLERFPKLMAEMEDNILAAIQSATEQAEEDDSEKIEITLKHDIKILLHKNTQKDSLAVATRSVKSIEGKLGDPDQENLPLD